ncbi:carbonate dehydratase [Comamonas humi]
MSLDCLLARNRAWSARMSNADPGFFKRLAQQQAPRYFWIGCSDSRVPSNQILDLAPGEVFTHRNVANLVPRGDLNSLSALQFAVEVLKVRHVMVVGHYGCSGIRASLDGARLGLVDNWLGYVQEVHIRHQELLAALPPDERAHRLCELNVAEQFMNICRTAIVNDAWNQGVQLSVHGLIYGLHNGSLHELGLTASDFDSSERAYYASILGGSPTCQPHFKYEDDH